MNSDPNLWMNSINPDSMIEEEIREATRRGHDDTVRGKKFSTRDEIRDERRMMIVREKKMGIIDAMFGGEILDEEKRQKTREEKRQTTKEEMMSGVLFICSSMTDKLSSSVVKELELVDLVKGELVNLKTVLSKVEKVLEDHSSGARICVRIWWNLLEDAAYDADDLLDALVTEALMFELEEEEVEKKKKKQLQIRSRFSSVNTIKDNMSKIAAVMDAAGAKLRFTPLTEEWRAHYLSLEEKVKRIRTSRVMMAESYVFGRDDDIEAISNRLLLESDNNDGSVQVVAICGMGGIGKTTLARHLFDSERVQNHFDITVWVNLYQELNVGIVTMYILQSLGPGGAFDSSSKMTKIQQLLCGKKFLIVLDDVRSVDYSKWNTLLSALQVGGSAGTNKILVTTRNQSVASMMGGLFPTYNLKLLSDEDCWLSFKQIAFPGSLPPSVAISLIRPEIVQRCGGLPLAAKVLGSLLHSNAGKNDWYDVTRSGVWDILREDMNSLVLPVLELSYDLLPGYLKLCFVYCSLFPAGYHFDKDELVLLWMAEGFVHQNEENQRMEDIAGNYFEELRSMSFFEISRVDPSNDRPRYKMHDLIHELARSLANSQKFFLMEENNSLCIPKEARHSSLLYKQCGTSMFESFYCSKGLRTLLLLGAHITHIDRLPRDLFLRLKRLRVLDLSHTSLMDVPNSIGNLLHLRYLNLSSTHVKVLPDSICDLYNLQTLRLSNCSELVAMPRGMRKLINLRHLQLDSVSRLLSMPAKIGRLTSLQTLTVFVVGRESGHRIRELKKLIELRGELQILKLENVVSLEEAEEAMLQGKKYLHKLELRWTEFKDDGVVAVLRGLQPPSSLRELQIVNYGGSQFPSWMADPKFLHLVSISLYNCIKCQLLPPLGQLPRLKYIRIDGMDRVKNIDHDFCGGGQVNGFPELEILAFENMTDLEEWQGVVEGDIHMLRKLTITGCSKLRTLPELIIFKDLQDLEISHCPELPSLPEKGMPAMLRSLTITNCPKLKEHLQNEEGKDWHKIEHIPTIWID